jgi:hypothetical protein
LRIQNPDKITAISADQVKMVVAVGQASLGVIGGQIRVSAAVVPGRRQPTATAKRAQWSNAELR